MNDTAGTAELLNALTIDVEDYYQVSAFEHVVSRSDWDQFPSRVVDNTRRMLHILAEREQLGTFFVLGWVAEKYPELVREIDAAGHEIGSHSYWHRLVYSLTSDEFRQDLRQSKQVLEDITGKPVTTYRAPSCSITRKSLWALEILVEEGFVSDSSIFPIRHDRYGIRDACIEIHTIDTPSGPIVEFPMSVARISRVQIPASGGGYFRLYPYHLTHRLCSRVINAGRPVMIYLHPWEIDPNQPLVKGVSLARRRRHRINLERTENRLKRLLGDFSFAPMTDVIQANQSATDKVVECSPQVSRTEIR